MRASLAIWALAGALLGWGGYNPSGDIQAYSPGVAGNSNVITGDFTVNGNQTVSGNQTVGSVANNGNETIAGALIQTGAQALLANQAAGWLQVGSGIADQAGTLFFGDQGAANGVKLTKYGSGNALILRSGSGSSYGTLFGAGFYLGGGSSAGMTYSGNDTWLMAPTSGALKFYSNGLLSGAADANQNWTLGANSNNTLTLNANTIISTLVDGSFQLTNKAGGTQYLYLGPTSASGYRLAAATNGVLTIEGGGGGNTQVTVRNTISAFRYQATGYVGSQIYYGNSSWTLANGAITFPTATSGAVAFTKATGTLTGPAFTFDGNTVISGDFTAQGNVTIGTGSVVGGRLMPINPNSNAYYRFDDCDNYAVSSAYTVNGNWFAQTNSSLMPANPDHPGIYTVYTNTGPTGGAITAPINQQVTKSSTITYQWRVVFGMPLYASDANDRYVFNVGSFNYNAAGPWAGPYISYSDNVNSGKWVINLSAGSTVAAYTANTSVAAPAPGSWHVLVITNVNGIYTYTLDGTSLGTLDASAITGTQWAAHGGSIQIIPSSVTKNIPAYMDAWDVLITGLAR